MSGEYVEKLKHRARVFLGEARSVKDPDLAAFFAEQAMQLYIKAVYYELFGDLVRGHRLRELLSILARSLDKHGFNDLSSRLREFVEEFREALILGEEGFSSYIGSCCFMVIASSLFPFIASWVCIRLRGVQGHP